jgi:XTP/dITP diphosphohydrolase
MQIVIASHNLHKIRELKSIFKPLAHLDIYSLKDFASLKLPDETGSTFEENSIIKAKEIAKILKKWVIADDSGLVVPSLNGEPGIYSARYAGLNATDRENRQKLLKNLQGKKGLERAAYFECCLTLASPELTIKTFKGIVEGILLEEERGKNGFGYDPIFLKHDYNQTFAQIDEETKNRISHRRKAVEKLKLYLEALNINN